MVGVVDPDDVRRIALSLRTRWKLTATVSTSEWATAGSSGPTRSTFGVAAVLRTDIAVLYVGDEAEKQALLLSEPEVFFTTSTYDWSPLVMVRLERIDITRLCELVTDAWHMRASRRVEGRTSARPRRERQTELRVMGGSTETAARPGELNSTECRQLRKTFRFRHSPCPLSGRFGGPPAQSFALLVEICASRATVRIVRGRRSTGQPCEPGVNNHRDWPRTQIRQGRGRLQIRRLQTEV